MIIELSNRISKTLFYTIDAPGRYESEDDWSKAIITVEPKPSQTNPPNDRKDLAIIPEIEATNNIDLTGPSEAEIGTLKEASAASVASEGGEIGRGLYNDYDRIIYGDPVMDTEDRLNNEYDGIIARTKGTTIDTSRIFNLLGNNPNLPAGTEPFDQGKFLEALNLKRGEIPPERINQILQLFPDIKQDENGIFILRPQEPTPAKPSDNF